MGSKILFSLVMFGLASGCAASDAGPVVSSGDRYTEAAGLAVVEDYRLGVGDKVRMTVFNEKDLSGEFAVAANGTLSLPLIGDVPALGKQVDEIVRQVQSQFAAGYLRDPKVSMEVVTYRPFFILGEVKAPGQYPFAIGLTALNAVATAQGFTPRSDRKTVYVRRSGASNEEAYKLTPALKILPGDTIRVGERYF